MSLFMVQSVCTYPSFLPSADLTPVSVVTYRTRVPYRPRRRLVGLELMQSEAGSLFNASLTATHERHLTYVIYRSRACIRYNQDKTQATANNGVQHALSSVRYRMVTRFH